MNNIKNKINSFFKHSPDYNIEYNDLENILSRIIKGEENREIIYLFLDLLHFPHITKVIAKNNKSDYWALKIAKIIENYNFNTGQLLWQRTQRYKDKTLFISIEGDEKTKISYNKFWSDILRTGKSIYSISNISNPVIGILSFNQYKSAMIDLCCLALGFRIIPVPPNSTSEHLSYILKESEINYLFIGGQKCSQLWNSIYKKHENIKIIDINSLNLLKGKTLSWNSFQDAGENNNDFDYNIAISAINMNETTTIMYTSGSTNNPKGVTFNQTNIISKRFARALALPDLSSDEIFLCYLPLFHTFGRYFELIGSIFWGATYAFAEAPSFNSLLKDFKLVTPTIFISIPKRWVQLYELVNENIDLDFSSKNTINQFIQEITGGNLKWGLSAAGYLDPDIFEFFNKNNIHLLSGYGMTEATGGITMTPPLDYFIDSVGKPLPGIELKLLEDGELCMKGPYVSKGFYKIDSSDSFINGWFHSGDIFEEKNGHYFIIDRKKDIYKNSRGQTLAPQKIENLFQDFELVKSVFLVGDGKEFNTVLIYPNKETDKYNLLELNDIEINEIFSSMLISVNSFLVPFERIVNFTIINRDFSIEKNELTQKGTYKRNNIIKNFKPHINNMYKKDYVSLRSENKEVRIPNWLIREAGTIKSNIKWNGQKIIIDDKSNSLKLYWTGNQISIGNFNYNIDSNILDIKSMIKSPKLWLGNQEFVDFCFSTVFRIKESVNYQTLKLIINENIFMINDLEGIEEYDSENQLDLLHNALKLYLSGNLSFIKHIEKFINHINNDWSNVFTDVFIQYQAHPDSQCRLKLLETISPVLSSKYFVDQLKSNYRYLNKISKDQNFNFNVSKITEKQYSSIIELLKDMHMQIDELDQIDINFIQEVLAIICEYGKIHPTKFISARSELIWWQLSDSPKKIQSAAQKEYYNLINGFRQWIGSNTPLTIDRESKEEYTWLDVITFDENVREKHKNILSKAIVNTSLIKEAIFLFSGDTILQLADIPKNGIWIKHITTINGKTSFRVLVKTIALGSYNIVINLNNDLGRDFFEDEIKWLIQMGSGSGQNQLVEKFGGYWPEELLYTEEYITDETVGIYLERNKEEISDLTKKDRWQMRWLHFIWNGMQAYIEFWFRTNYRLAIKPPTPDNLIIPQHDYTTGTRLISISDRKNIDSVGQFYLDLFYDYIIETETKYRGLKHMASWELIFTATLEAMKVKKAMPILEKLKDDLSKKEFKSKFISVGLTKKRINSFFQDFEKYGVLTKPVVFAALRFERWLELNPIATNKAKASILKELYHDYNLNSLLEEYPETRVRFFMMTCLKDCSKELEKYFRIIIKDMRLKKINPYNLNDSIDNIIENATLNENERFFLARMLYPHIDAADFVELVKTQKGESENLDLVYKTEDSLGNIYSIRPAFQPKEIAKFQIIINRENLSATFTTSHKFLLILNKRNNVSGGLYYTIKADLVVHLEWVVIEKKYQGLKLSKRLMEDFFNRMKQKGIKTITVGFYHENFFYKQGFKIDQSYGGLVKKL